jgi:hypothetical protein
LIEADAAQHIGADRYERSASRTTHRTGTRARLLSTKAGDVELRIPKLRDLDHQAGPGAAGGGRLLIDHHRSPPVTGRHDLAMAGRLIVPPRGPAAVARRSAG